MKELRLKARAKINLGLDVLRKREDGYHEVRMIMQTIPLFDRIYLKRSDEPGIRIQTNLSDLPVNRDNLVYKAAELLMDEFEVKEGLDIILEKQIPVAAGMAGGSSDAAAVLKGVNQIFELGLTQEELMQRGVRIGADVPYCILGETALAEGIGEKLTTLPPMPSCFLVIAKPDISVSTQFVYGNLKANELKEHPDIDRQIEALKQKDINALCDAMGNVLETVTIPAYPVIEELKETMRANGAAGTLMSGSGPTVFGIFEREEDAQNAYKALKERDLKEQVFMIKQA